MPELPDITVYVDAIERRVVGQVVEGLRLASPFVLRTVEPRPEALSGRRVQAVQRIGKRITLRLEDELFVIIHLMIAGRLHFKPPGAPLSRRTGLFALDLPTGTLLATEASTKKRAALHLAQGEAALAGFERGGVELLEASRQEVEEALRQENHTLKRALTDPRIVSGVGNAYSDEILHRARLSPFKQTGALSSDEVARLYTAARTVLSEWVARLRREAGEDFPQRVTAFHPKMAVHGRYREPCPVCGAKVQRIRYADNETNYCPTCQTGRRLLADRALSRLLKDDWPRTLEELEELRRPPPGAATEPPDPHSPRPQAPRARRRTER